MSEQLIIINNEKITFDNNKFYCDNIDVKSIPEGLENFFELEMIARNSSVKKFHHVNIKEINQNLSNTKLNYVNTKIENIRVIKGTNFNYFSDEGKRNFFASGSSFINRLKKFFCPTISLMKIKLLKILNYY